MPVTYDLEVTASKYLHQLDDGEVPLRFMFSGTCFTRGGVGLRCRTGALAPGGCVPDARRCLAGDAWTEHFPGTGWLRLDRDTLAALTRYKAEARPNHVGLGGGTTCSRAG